MIVVCKNGFSSRLDEVRLVDEGLCISSLACRSVYGEMKAYSIQPLLLGLSRPDHKGGNTLNTVGPSRVESKCYSFPFGLVLLVCGFKARCADYMVLEG